MNKLNVFLTAAAFATVITGLLYAVPGLNHTRFMDWVYFPAIVMAVLFSGSSHSPGAIAGWSAFIAYTLIYLLVFVISYALLAELYLVRRAASATRMKAYELRADAAAEPDDYLAKIGTAVAELEAKRRRHFLLEGISGIDLSQPPVVIGAQSVASSAGERPIKLLLKQFENETAKAYGAEDAARIMREVRQRASEITAAGGRQAAT